MIEGLWFGFCNRSHASRTYWQNRSETAERDKLKVALTEQGKEIARWRTVATELVRVIDELRSERCEEKCSNLDLGAHHEECITAVIACAKVERMAKEPVT